MGLVSLKGFEVVMWTFFPNKSLFSFCIRVVYLQVSMNEGLSFITSSVHITTTECVSTHTLTIIVNTRESLLVHVWLTDVFQSTWQQICNIVKQWVKYALKGYLTEADMSFLYPFSSFLFCSFLSLLSDPPLLSKFCQRGLFPSQWVLFSLPCSFYSQTTGAREIN